jgi:hypothetical protein
MNAIGRLGSLTELTMVGSNNGITDVDYKAAFEQGQMIALQRLELRGCRNFGKKATVALFKYCQNLKNLICRQLHQLGGMEEAVAECGPSAIYLQKLEMSWCPLKKNDIMAVARLCNLRELHLSGTRSGQDYKDAFQQGNLGRHSPIFQ